MKAILSLLLLVALGCAPSLDSVELEVKQNIDQRLGTAESSRPVLKDRKLAEWIAAKLREPLTIDDVSELALVNNPSLHAVYSQLAIDRADLLDSVTPENPFLLVERRFRGSALELDVGQNILSLLFLPSQRRFAEAKFEIAKLRAVEQISAKMFEGRLAFIGYQRSRAALAASERRRKSADAALVAAEELRRSGNLTKSEFFKSRLKAVRAKLECAYAESEDREARSVLSRLLGLSPTQFDWKIREEFPKVPEVEAGWLTALEESALTSRVDLEAKKRELESLAEIQGVRNITAIVPDLKLTGHYEHEPTSGFSAGPSIELPLPLFNFGSGGRERARAEIDKSRNELLALAQDIRLEVAGRAYDLEVRRQAVAEVAEQLIPVASNAFAEGQRLYNGMLLGVLPLIESREIQLDAEAELDMAVAAYWEASVALERSIGRILVTHSANIPREEN